MSRDLETRVRRLERAHRAMILVALAAVLAFISGGKADSGETDRIRARRFELVDEAGMVRAVLGTDAEGATGLFINDPEGSVRLIITHDPEQSALFIHDGEGTVRIGVAQFAHGGGGVALHGAGSKGAAVLYYKESGSLSVYDAEGNPTLRLPEK